MTTFSVSPQPFHDSALCMDTDAFSLIMIIIVVFIEKHNKQKKVVQCQIFKLEMEILFFLFNANKKRKQLVWLLSKLYGYSFSRFLFRPQML
jgi:hypothetical protein